MVSDIYLTLVLIMYGVIHRIKIKINSISLSAYKTTFNNTKRYVPKTKSDYDYKLIYTLYDLTQDIEYFANEINMSSPLLSKEKYHKNINSITNNFITDKNYNHLLSKELNKIDYLMKSNKNLSYGESNNFLSNLIISDIDRDLNMAKQARWLMKNSPVSRLLTNNNNLYNESKKLISNELKNPKITDSNIWVSNFFKKNSIKIFDKNNDINPNLIESFNFFEESREFFTKRFIFLSSQKNPIYATNFLKKYNITDNNINNKILFDISKNEYILNVLVYDDFFFKNIQNNFIDEEDFLDKISNIDYKVFTNDVEIMNNLNNNFLKNTIQVYNVNDGKVFLNNSLLVSSN